MEKYLLSYAHHFGLDKKARLSTSVRAARWEAKLNKWRLQISKQGSPPSENDDWEYFDKVVFCMGTDQVPMTPKIPGMEKFEGHTEHSVSFKRPETLKGKKVMVLGFGNTAADMATELSKHADQVYLAHRHGAIIVSFLSSIYVDRSVL